MLDAWYFAACVQVPPTQMSAFLGVVDALTAPDSEERQLEVALDQLPKAEPTVRHYAIPLLIALGLRDDEVALGVRTAVRRALVDALADVDKAASEPLLNAWGEVTRSGDDEAVLAHLRAVCGATEPRWTALVAESVPYFAVDDCVAELTILAMLAHAVPSRPSLARGVVADEALSRLLTLGLSGRFGRLAFLVAVETATLLDDHVSAVGLIDAPRSFLTPGSPWEPDVLSAFARTQFGYPGRTAGSRAAAETVTAIALEAATFQVWDTAFRNDPRPGRADQEAVSRMGLTGRPDIAMAMSLWQAVLWELACEFDPAAACREIADAWRPPDAAFQAPVRVWLPIPSNRLDAWRRRADALAALRGTAPEIVLDAKPSLEARLPPTFQVAVTSPWMTFVGDLVPRETDGLALLRLLTSGLTAIRLIRSVDPDDQTKLVPFLFHLEQILSRKIHRGSVSNAASGKTTAEPSMAPPILGLAATVSRASRQVGSGRYERVAPARFVEFLTTPSSSRSTAFLQTRTSQHALARWLRDALSGSLPGDRVGQGRWRSGEPGATSAETALRTGASAPNATAAALPLSLLVSYFDPDFPRAQKDAWFTSQRPNLYVTVEAALAAPRLDVEGWLGRDIPTLIGKGGVTPQVALETLRLDALMRAGIGVRPEFGGWVEDWHRLMDRIDDPTLLRRELRVVMLRLLDRAIEGTNQEYAVLEHLLDVEVELGWGTPYDRWLMFDLLGRGTKLPPETARRLRQRLLVALYHDERAQSAGGVFSDPWWVLDQRENRDLLAQLMRRFVVDIGHLESDLHDRGLAAHLESLWLSAHRAGALRELELGRVGEWLDSHDRRLLVGAVPDARADDLRVHLLPEAAQASGAGVIDAFTEPPAESAERARAGARLVGMVAATQGDRLWVNAWLDKPVEVTSGRGVRVGDLVEFRAHGSPLGIVAERAQGVEAVRTAPVPGAVRDAVLAVVYGPDETKLRLTVDGVPSIDLDIDIHQRDIRALWMPDLVGLLTRTAPETTAVPAIWNGSTWVPVELGVSELLASLGDDTGRLVVVEARRGRMLVAPAPGRLVSVADEAWDPDDLRRIDDMTPQRDRMRGLVLAVRAAVDGDGAPRLRLAEDESGVDDRAVRWAAVFDDEGDYEAWPDDAGRPVFDSRIEGLPLIGVGGIVGASGAFRPSQWRELDQRRAVVSAEPVATSKLQIAGRGLGDLRPLLEVRPGSRLVLQGVRRGAWSGTRRGVLVNELQVEVEAESLNFGVRDAQGRQIKGRRVEVTVVTMNDGKGLRTPYASGIDDGDLLDSVDAEWHDDVRMDLGHHRAVRGIVVEAPNAPSAGSVYEVWFDLGQAVSVVPIRRDAFEIAPRGVGDIVTGTPSGGRWGLVARQRRIRVRGLWTIGTSAPRKGGHVLGAVPWEGALRNVVQDPYEPVLYLVQGPARPHLTFVNARGQANPRPDADSRAGRLERTPLWLRSDGRMLRRVVLHVQSGGGVEVDLAGDVVNDLPDADAEVERVDLLLESIGDGHYGVRRLFTVSRTIRETERFHPADPSDGLAAYLESPIPLEAELVGSSTVRLHTSWSVPVDGSLTKDVPLAANEEPWVDVDGGYPRRGIRVLLTLEGGRVVASYRSAPALSLEAAVDEFRRQGVSIGERHPLRQRLRYVDRRETAEGVHHRFEWGYGWVCSIPESRLTIGGQAEPNWPMVPFHGDEITHLLVSRDHAGLRIDIDVDAIDQGFLSELYLDAQQGVVSTATIELEVGARPRITALHVRDRRTRDLDPQGRYDDGRQVAVQRMRLTDKAVAAIAVTGVKTGMRLAFVRLMTGLFAASGGRAVEFDFVSPRLGGEGALRPQDRVFLAVTRPFATRNDVGLELSASDIVGAEKPLKVSVLRRDFSWREDLLRRLVLDRRGELVSDALVGDVYLVRITGQRQDRFGRVRGVVAGSLARPVRTLHSHVKRSSDACFAIVDSESDRLGLEIRPNVVFRLQQSEFEADGPIGDRSIVRVLSRDGRLFLSTALGGDASYVPRAGRPVILLPMQTLLHPRDTIDDAIRSGEYTAAGLPQLRASARPGDDPAFARELLTTPHPKVASLRKQDGRWRIEPLDDGDLRAATFVYEPDGTVSATFGDGTVERIEWDRISFRDVGAAKLRNLPSRAAWTYHDETTSHRSPDGEPAPPTLLEAMPRHEADPVFFTRDLGLRYAGRELERVGFPAREMLAGTTMGADEPSFVVAGLARRNKVVVGLWLEASPGHLVEVTSSMFAETLAGTVTTIDWSHFAVGDLVKLRSWRSTAAEIANLRLAGWAPGPRAAFGRRALLPVRSTDAGSQTVTLGDGVWRLDRPLEPDVEFAPAGRMVWLTRYAMRIAAEGVGVRNLEVGDAVLVGLVDGQPVVRGIEHSGVELWAEPGSPDQWIVELLRRGDASLLDLLGGCLPFTVRAVDGDALVLDRSGQQGALRASSTVPGEPLGVVEGQVVVRAGARIYRCAPDAVVPGLPLALLGEAVTALARHARVIWLVSDDRGRVGIGVRAASTQDIHVGPVAVLSSGEEFGVLCWDAARGSAVWLPSGRMGWMSPDATQVEAWVSSVRTRSSRTVLVAVLGNGTVSISDTITARHRLGQLRAGGLLRIEIVGESFVLEEPGRARYLARLHLSDVLLEFVTRADQQNTGAGARFGEVESIDAGVGGTPTVCVADQSAREFRAALPAWFLRSGDHRLEVPARFDAYRGAAGVDDGDPLDVALVRDADSVLGGATATPGLLDEWLGRHGVTLFGLRDGELDLPPALAAAFLLATAPGAGDPVAYARAAVHALRQIGLRSAMSRHLGPLLQLWLAEPTPRRGLWGRLDAITVAPRMSREQVDSISRLCAAIRSRTAAAPDEQLALYGESVAASIGAHARYDTIADHADLLHELSDLGRALTPRHDLLTAQGALVSVQVAHAGDAFRRSLVETPVTLLGVPRSLQDPAIRDAAAMLSELGVGLAHRT